MTDYRFGAGSLAQLTTLDERLKRVLIRALSMSPIDFRILEGYRDKKGQDTAVLTGTSQVLWPNGKHNHFPSLAADLSPVPIDWVDRERFALLAGVVLAAAKIEGIPVRWGGDWDQDGRMTDEHFRDMGHYEVVEAHSAPTTVET